MILDVAQQSEGRSERDKDIYMADGEGTRTKKKKI